MTSPAAWLPVTTTRPSRLGALGTLAWNPLFLLAAVLALVGIYAELAGGGVAWHRALKLAAALLFDLFFVYAVLEEMGHALRSLLGCDLVYLDVCPDGLVVATEGREVPRRLPWDRVAEVLPPSLGKPTTVTVELEGGASLELALPVVRRKALGPVLASARLLRAWARRPEHDLPGIKNPASKRVEAGSVEAPTEVVEALEGLPLWERPFGRADG